jgi:O-antigen/teichoic acid export membrane protein
MSATTTTLPAAAAPSAAETAVNAATRRHLRGSSILFLGRLISLGLNFVTQVLIVRYLSKADFGAFAYGLSIASMGQTFSVLGLDKAASRFLPIYDERGERNKLLGALMLVTGSVIAVGTAVVGIIIGFNGLLGGSVAATHTGVTVLLIMAALAPLQALDDVLLGVFAVFSRPRAIFFRKYVLAPSMRLGAIAFVLLSQGSVTALAVGYVFGGLVGILAYAVMLAATMRSEGVLTNARLRDIQLPIKEIFSFALPLVAVDMLTVVTNSSNIIMLGHFGTPQDVANYRVVLPAAQLNIIMLSSFGVLFTPIAARMFARKDTKGIHELYWRTAVWISVLSFPVFAATFSTSHAVTVLLFGHRYASSAPILALLSLGYYFNAALGFNGLTLRVFGLVRYSVVISIVAGVFNIAINLALIPTLGALGAGIGTCATFIFHNILKQSGLRLGTGISVFDPHHARVYAVILGATAALAALAIGLHAPPYAAIVMVAAASAAVVTLTRNTLRVGDMFPELLRMPLVRRLFG